MMRQAALLLGLFAVAQAPAYHRLLTLFAEADESSRNLLVEVAEGFRRRERVRQLIERGASPSEIVKGLRGLSGLSEFQRVLADLQKRVAIMRDEYVRLMVDVDRLALSEIASLMGVSRQRASQLYHSAHNHG